MKDSPNLLDGYYQSTLEEDLGRALTPEEFGSIKDLNEIPEQCVEQLRKLSGIEAEYFLEYLWHSEPRDDAKLVTIRYFLNDVISRGEDPRSWRRGGAFFPNGGDGEWLFQSSITEILRDLEKKPNETWVVFPVPDQLLWLDSLHGAPCLVRPNETYRWHERRYRQGLHVARSYGATESFEPIRDIFVATRRWVALKAAGTIGFDQIDGNPGELLCAKVPEIQTYSADALIALRALHAERLLMPNEKRKLPGFRGPDAWYAGELPEGV